jgi:hypothetical protein
MTRRTKTAALVAVLASTGALLAQGTPAISKSGTPLSGTLELAPGRLVTTGGRSEYTGTYFRMLEPGETDEYFPNGSSHAKNTTYTLLAPGTDGGLKLGAYQPPPSPAFTGAGNARAHRITVPESFTGIEFSISTARKDAQSGASVPTPSLTLNGAKLTGNFSAWTAEWNKIYFNQGAPKPNGSYPGLTRPVTGTYDAKTHAFTIIWYSQIVGGPFTGFTGFWHLEGRVKS